MATGYTTVSAAHLTDASGALINNATIYFTPVGADRRTPISFRTNGGGQSVCTPISAAVVNGAFTVQLADTSLTSPANIGYSVTVIDNLTGVSLLGPGYECIQPSGAAWSLDTFVPYALTLAYGKAPEVVALYAQTIDVSASPNGVFKLYHSGAMRGFYEYKIWTQNIAVGAAGSFATHPSTSFNGFAQSYFANTNNDLSNNYISTVSSAVVIDAATDFNVWWGGSATSGSPKVNVNAVLVKLADLA